MDKDLSLALLIPLSFVAFVFLLHSLVHLRLMLFIYEIISFISIFFVEPLAVLIVTFSPIFLPSIALPIAESEDNFLSFKSASCGVTNINSVSFFNLKS